MAERPRTDRCVPMKSGKVLPAGGGHMEHWLERKARAGNRMHRDDGTAHPAPMQAETNQPEGACLRVAVRLVWAGSERAR